MTPAQRLRELVSEASPTPWGIDPYGDGFFIVVGGDRREHGGFLPMGYDNEVLNEADARLIALAPQMAWLLADCWTYLNEARTEATSAGLLKRFTALFEEVEDGSG
jgi:hypothetical protein